MSRPAFAARLSLCLLLPASALLADVPVGKRPDAAESRPTADVAAAVSVGRKLRNEGNDVAAIKAFDDALTKARLLKDQAGEALALNNLATVYRYQAGLSLITANQMPPAELVNKAARYYEQALAAAKAAGDRFDAAYALLYLGVLAAGRGEGDAAFRQYNEALTAFKALDDRYYTARTLMFMGATELYRRQRSEASLQHFELALPLYRDTQYWHEAQAVLRDMAVAYDRLMTEQQQPK